MPNTLRLPALLTVLALAACAPMGGGGYGGPGERGGREGGMGGPGGAPNAQSGGLGAEAGMSVVAQLQTQLQQTAEALKLTPKQVVLWEAYQDKVSALMSDQMKLAPYVSTQQSAPQQIGRKVDTVRNRLAAMEDIQEAAARLYESLDATQKKTADQMLPQTVPALYSGFGSGGGAPGGERSNGNRDSGRSGGRGGMGGPGGGMGGGPGRF